MNKGGESTHPGGELTKEQRLSKIIQNPTHNFQVKIKVNEKIPSMFQTVKDWNHV